MKKSRFLAPVFQQYCDSVKGSGSVLIGPVGEYNIVVNLSEIAGSPISKLSLLFLKHGKCCNPLTLYTRADDLITLYGSDTHSHTLTHRG